MGRWCRTSGTWLQLERAQVLPRQPAWGSPLLSYFPHLCGAMLPLRPQTLPAAGTTSPTLHQQQNKELLLLHQVQQPCINQACGGFSSIFILFLNTTSTQQGLPVVTPPSLAMIEPFVHAAAATAQQVTSIIYCNTAYGCSLFYLSPLNNYLSYIRYFSKELSASEVSLL